MSAGFSRPTLLTQCKPRWDIYIPSEREREIWVYPGVSSHLEMPGRPSNGGTHGGILIRCPNHLIYFPSMRRRSSSLHVSQMSELLTLSLRLSPATLQRKLFDSLYLQSHSCSSYPELMFRVECWKTGNGKSQSFAFWLSSVFTTVLTYWSRTEILKPHLFCPNREE